MPPAVIAGGAVIAGSLLSARSQRKAAGKAADAQRQAAQESIAVQEAAQKRLEERLKPFEETGLSALPGLSEAILGPQQSQEERAQSVLSDPFFRALAEDQEQRLLASAAARGKVGSGGTQDALMRNLLLMGSDFRRQQELDRQMRIENLFGLTQMGQQSAAGVGSAGLRTGGQIASTLAQMGNVEAARQAQIGASKQALPDLLTMGGGLALGKIL
ncbi:MAG: hypothetical protein EP297_00120 [Gammaproteobacteria bacterium]|nr:MAG: hypothetical protein EP297_00120 [Gammaproteobacteria bacterium]